MGACCCSLAGTSACQHCPNNSMAMTADNISTEAYKNYGRAFIVQNPKPMTNADRIRAMTDEELAEWFAGHDAGLVANVLNNDYVEPTKGSWLEWLKQECES